MTKAVVRTAQGRLNPDVEELAPSWMEVDWNPDETAAKDDPERELRCVSIARELEAFGPGTPSFEIGLVVARAGGDGDRWGRFGVFKQLREGVPLFPESVSGLVEMTLL